MLDESVNKFKKDIYNESYSVVDDFKRDFRKKIYPDIDNDIGNDDFKRMLEKRTKECLDILSSNLNGRINSISSNFEENIGDILERYKKYAEELQSIHESSQQFDKCFKSNIDIKSNIDWGSIARLLISIGGVVLAFLAGPILGCIALVGALVTGVKIVLGWLNHNYRMSQQRKTADEHIDKIGRKIIGEIETNIEKANKSSIDTIENIKKELKKIPNRISEINKLMSDAVSKLAQSANNIKKSIS